MNLMKAVVDHAPALLDEIDTRMAALVQELRTLQAQRVQLVMQLTLVSLDSVETPRSGA